MKTSLFCRRNLLPLLLLILSGAAFAQSTLSADSMLSAVSATDMAGNVLAEVFGRAFFESPGVPGGKGDSIIADMFSTFNAGLLAVGVFWFAYNVAAATVQTAEGGEFMGQRFSTIWLPIRFGVGISALVPMFGGYCGAQVLMMYFAKLGIGLANLLVTAALSSLGGFNTAAAAIHQDAKATANAMFMSNVCVQSLTEDQNNYINSGVEIIAGALGKESVSVAKSKDGLTYFYSNPSPSSALSDDVCGKIGVEFSTKITNSQPDGLIDMSPLLPAAQKAHSAALAAMQTTMGKLATTYIDANVAGTEATVDIKAGLDAAALAYETSVTTELKTQASQISQNAVSKIQDQIKQKGWMALGSWYQSLAVISDTVSAVAAGRASITSPKSADTFAYSPQYQKILSSLGNIPDLSPTTQAAQTGSSNDALAKIFGTGGSNRITNIVANWTLTGSNGVVNPIIEFKNLGDAIIFTAETGLGTYLILNSGAKAVEGVGASVSAIPVVGSIVGGLTKAVGSVIEAFAPFIIMIITALFIFGVTLAVYIPMLPFVVWFGALATWFACVAEGLIAAPVGAFAHLEAEGDGMGQRSQHSYLFLFNVLLRPGLMVFGFFIASLGIKAFGPILLALFAPAMANAQFNSMTGIVMFVGYLILFTSLGMTMIHSLLALIHIVPDQVIAWVGGQVTGTIGKDADERSHNNFAAGLSHSRSAAQGSIKPGKKDVSAIPAAGSARAAVAASTER